MLDQSKNNKGFTLAELLMAVAIILVLAAIAIPSIANAQRNMHMVELDSAANQIALAAQNQMTSMKVSGTWLDALEKSGIRFEGDGAQTAKNTPSGSTGDTFYLTRAQIVSLGILTPLSIEQTVFDGDYIIEFVKSTASVYGVFYSDGRTGAIWNSGPAATGVMDTYYVRGSASPDQATRRSNNPPIGYYGGTPAGATNAVVLAKPNIWMDDKAQLCIQDVHITQNPTYKTGLEITVGKNAGDESKQASFVIVAQPTGDKINSFSIGTTKDTTITIMPSEGKEYPLMLEERDAGSGFNVVSIDLNMLLKAVGENSTENGKAIADELQKFTAKDTLKITAEVSAKNISSIPAKAEAYVEWPGKLSKLQVLVTNPKMENPSENFGLKTYTDPTVDPKINVDGEMKFYEDTVSGEIEGTLIEAGKDPGASKQVYTGKWVSLEKVLEKKGIVKATVGSYENAALHQYQIYEIRVNDIQIGYLDEGIWKWNQNHDYIVDKNGNVINSIDSSTGTVYIDPTVMSKAESGVSGDSETGSYEVYIRTAPSLSDVSQFLANNKGKMVNELANGLGSASISSTTARAKGQSLAFQKSFLTEFGASSSVASWTAKMGNLSTADNLGFSASDVYLYYAATPYEPKVDSSALNPAVLRAVRGEATSEADYAYTLETYAALGTSFDAADTRLPKDSANSVRLVELKGEADFALSTTVDLLYFRTLTYYDKSNNAIPYVASTPPYNPWVPNRGINADGLIVPYANAALAVGQDIDLTIRFSSWRLKQDREGSAYLSGETVSEADDSQTFPLGNVSLYAKYREYGIGFAYIETMSDNKILYEGYLGDSPTKQSNFSEYETDLYRDQTVESWGYYVVVKKGLPTPQLDKTTSPSNNLYLAPKKEITLESDTYDCYEVKKNFYTTVIDAGDAFRAKQYVNIGFGFDASKITARYNVNFNFARMIDDVTEDDSGAAALWGMSDSTPFIVRYASQFPGTFSTQNGIQSAYTENKYYFAQQRNIDAANRPTANKDEAKSGSKFNTVFRGTYDGGYSKGEGAPRKGTYSITNFRYWVGSYVTNYELEIKVNGQGIFSVIEDADIRNIALVDTAGGEWSITQEGGASYNFGSLVGVANNSTIENCSVNASTIQAGASPLTMKAKTSASSPKVGGLVGYATKDSKVIDCSATQLTLSINKKGSANWFNDSLVAGGLVGYLGQDSSILAGKNQPAQVSTVTIETDYLPGPYVPKDNYLKFGSLVGSVNNGTVGVPVGNELVVGHATISFTGHTIEEMPFTKMYVGALAGYTNPAVTSFTNTVSTYAAIMWSNKDDIVLAQVGNK